MVRWGSGQLADTTTVLPGHVSSLASWPLSCYSLSLYTTTRTVAVSPRPPSGLLAACLPPPNPCYHSATTTALSPPPPEAKCKRLLRGTATHRAKAATPLPRYVPLPAAFSTLVFDPLIPASTLTPLVAGTTWTVTHNGPLRAAGLFQLQLQGTTFFFDRFHLTLRTHYSKTNRTYSLPHAVRLSTHDPLSGFSTLRVFWTRFRLARLQALSLPTLSFLDCQ